MAKRFFTSDWHLGMSTLLNKNVMHEEARNFRNVNEMNETILKNVLSQSKKDDLIIHVGDLACYNSTDVIKPNEILQKIDATLINIHGNHDTTNKVKSLCTSMRLTLGKKYTAVSVSHYPTYDKHATNQFLEGDIHICGHIHKKWKHCLDLTHKCLNINVGVDVWNYMLVSEDDLIKYIDKLLYFKADKLNKIVIENGKVKYL